MEYLAEEQYLLVAYNFAGVQVWHLHDGVSLVYASPLTPNIRLDKQTGI
jgi:hypothetical protein